MERELIGTRELGEMLGLAVGTIQQYSSRRPSRLPAPISAPRCTLRWRKDDVEQWIKTRQQSWVQLDLPLEQEPR